LDGLRALSIALVLVNHLGAHIYFSEDSWVGFLLNPVGNFGVHVFFAISGFLITMLLLQEMRSRGRIDLRSFYIRRCFRILPAAYVFLFVCVFCFRALPLQDKVLSALFLENYSTEPIHAWPLAHLWTLGVEEQFYLLWPVLFVRLPDRRVALLAATLLIAPCLHLVNGYFGSPVNTGAFPFVADGLACGCLLALLWPRPGFQRLLRSQWFVLVPILTLVSVPFNETGGSISGRLARDLLLRPGLNIGIALSIGWAVQRAPSFLNWGPLMRSGVWSYSLYLWQQPLSHGGSWSGSLWLDLPLRLAAIFLCAIASYQLVELPFLRLRRRFVSTPPPTGNVTSAAPA
jgi:peptidoglycan/LPS O-acetylase OafA/YrhL